MHQGTSESNVVIFHETVVEVGVELLRRCKPTAQLRGVVLGDQLTDRDLQRMMIPVLQPRSWATVMTAWATAPHSLSEPCRACPELN